MSADDDIVERLRENADMMRDGHQDNLTELWHSEVVLNAAKDAEDAADLITQLRAERDAAARDMRERCAKVALNSYDLMFPKPRNRITAENAGHAVSQAIRALPDPPAGIATSGEVEK